MKPKIDFFDPIHGNHHRIYGTTQDSHCIRLMKSKTINVFLLLFCLSTHLNCITKSDQYEEKHRYNIVSKLHISYMMIHFGHVCNSCLLQTGFAHYIQIPTVLGIFFNKHDKYYRISNNNGHCHTYRLQLLPLSIN